MKHEFAAITKCKWKIIMNKGVERNKFWCKRECTKLIWEHKHFDEAYHWYAHNWYYFISIYNINCHIRVNSDVHAIVHNFNDWWRRYSNIKIHILVWILLVQLRNNESPSSSVQKGLIWYFVNNPSHIVCLNS